jgi:SAM-dependent methyltransferase
VNSPLIPKVKRALKNLVPETKLSRVRAFSNIYRDKKWGGHAAQKVDFHSGSGSIEVNTKLYEDMVVQFIHDQDIQSIVDIGCGDFQVSGRILDRIERPINYIGCDLVEELIARNRQKFGSLSVDFQSLDAVTEEIPPGELVLVREVLQHLPNKTVSKVLDKIKNRHFCLITNTIHQDMNSVNLDIRAGSGTRVGIGSGLDIRQPPFSVAATEVLVHPHWQRPHALLQTLLLKPQ